jgi:hypothetical protein
MKPKFPSIRIDIARPVVEKFGGVVPMSKLTGLLEQTIRAWLVSGVIPEKYRYGLLVIARENGIALTPSDYVDYMVDLKIAA